MKIKDTIHEALINRGKIHSKRDIIRLMKEYEEKFALKIRSNMIKYLSRHNYIRRIFLGYYYINSYDERIRRFCEYEDKEVLFMVLNKLNIKWYVGLAHSKYLQGKIWQIPNQIQIINTKFSGSKKIFGLKVHFFKTKEKLFFGLKKIKTKHNVEYFYSDPAKTYLDEVYFGESGNLIRIKHTQTYLKRYPKWVGKK